MRLKRFNESDEFKNPDEAIREFFIDYLDEDKDSLSITNGVVSEGEFIWKMDYIKKSDASKYKKAKLITLRVSKTEGFEVGTEVKCLTSLDPLKKAIGDIERFYALSEEDVNYYVNTSDEFLEVTFLTTGGGIDESETNGELIDTLLGELKVILNTSKGFGYKRINYKPNFLDIRTPAKDKNLPYQLTMLIRKVVNGQERGESRGWIKPLVDWVDKVQENGFVINVNDYDNQVVVVLKK